MKSGAAVLLGVLLLVLPASLAGQVEAVVDAGVGAFAGGDFSGTPPGPAVGVALHITSWEDAQGGLELGYARHAGSGVESAATQLSFLGFLRTSVLSGPVEGWLGGKAGAGRRSLTIVDEPAAADGFLIGPSAAVRFPLGGVRLQLTFDALYQTYEELVMYGMSEYGTDKDGFRLVFRAGLVFPLESPRDAGSEVR